MNWLDSLFGLNAEKMLPSQMAARAAFVFFISLAFVRVAGLRTLGKYSAFDHLTALMLGAVMGRSIVTTEQSFFGSLLAALTIMLLHRFVAMVTHASHPAGRLIKGEPLALIQNGERQPRNLRMACITEADLEEELRSRGKPAHVHTIKDAWLERSGKISICVR
jgi:uncharacterized membrane protein YcaP (DUF421 family)